MSLFKHLAVAFAIVLAASTTLADDLTGATTLLCSPAQVNGCQVDENCVSGSPWKQNVPRFIIIDLDEKTLGTTEASGKNRVTPIKNLERDGNVIILQGAEMGRAFSFVINETTGMITFSVALSGEGVVGFGACTPIPAK